MMEILIFKIFQILSYHVAWIILRMLQDRMSRSDDPNDYVVHDPLLEKGKEKFNKRQAKQKRREREWAGKSLT